MTEVQAVNTSIAILIATSLLGSANGAPRATASYTSRAVRAPGGQRAQDSWLTYENIQYGYRIRYPSFARVDTLNPAAVRFDFPRRVTVPEQPNGPIAVDYLFSIDVAPNPTHLAPEAWFSHSDSLTPGPDRSAANVLGTESLAMNGWRGACYRVFEGDEATNHIYITMGGFAYEVSYPAEVATTTRDYASFHSLFRHMLGSIHFSAQPR
jgi:hypothetical protein